MVAEQYTLRTPCKTNEFGFYVVYLGLQNVGKSNTLRLSQQEIICTALICMGDYVLTVDKSPADESEKYKLAREMKKYYTNFTRTAVYGVLASLKRKGILVERGNLFVLDSLTQGVKETVKQSLEEGQTQLQYSMDFTIE